MDDIKETEVESMSKVKQLLYACCFLFACVPQADATTILYQTLEKRIITASKIIRGKIISKRSFWTANKRSLYTDYTMLVYERLKGTAPKHLTFRQLGGQLDGHITHVPGSARYKLNEEVVLFFEPQRRPGFLFVMDLAAGKYNVVRSGNQTLLVRDIKRLAFYRAPTLSNQTVGHLSFSEAPLGLNTLKQQIRTLQPKMKYKVIPFQGYTRWRNNRKIAILKARQRALQAGQIDTIIPKVKSVKKAPIQWRIITPQALPRVKKGTTYAPTLRLKPVLKLQPKHIKKIARPAVRKVNGGAK